MAIGFAKWKLCSYLHTGNSENILFSSEQNSSLKMTLRHKQDLNQYEYFVNWKLCPYLHTGKLGNNFENSFIQ